MKTIAVIAFVCFSFFEIHAQDQIKQGVYSLGGSIYYSSKKYIHEYIWATYEDKSELYIISPNISYFVIDQFELNFNLAYSVEQIPGVSGPNSFPDYKNITLALGLGLRYYFSLGSIAPFIGSSGQIMWEKNEYGYGLDQSFSPPAFGFTISGGIEIFIAQTAAVEPIITYSKTRFEAEHSVSGIYIGIGVKYFIY